MRILAAFLFFTTIATAQTARQVTTRELAWANATFDYICSDTLSFNFDIQARRETDGDWHTFAARFGTAYKTKSGWVFAGGLARFYIYPDPNGKSPRPEWRPWEEIGRKFQLGMHQAIFPRFRFEQRFIREYDGNELSDRYSLSTFRERLRCDYTYTFSNERGFFLLAGDELMFNTKKDGNSFLDQNRIFGGVGYKLNNLLTLQLSYLHILLRKDRLHYEQDHVVRLTVLFQFARS